MRGHHAQECGIARGCSRCCMRAPCVTLPVAVSSLPVLCLGPSQSQPPRVRPTKPCLGSSAHKHCAAPLRCAEVLPLHYAGVAAARPRYEAPSRCGYHMRPLLPRACAILTAEPCAGPGRGRDHCCCVYVVVALPCDSTTTSRAIAASSGSTDPNHRVTVMPLCSS